MNTFLCTLPRLSLPPEVPFLCLPRPKQTFCLLLLRPPRQSESSSFVCTVELSALLSASPPQEAGASGPKSSSLPPLPSSKGEA